MKKIILLSAILLSAYFCANGQGTGKIDLRIVDQQQKPVSKTFAELLNAKDSSVVQYATSNVNGYVEFENLQKGKYLVFIPEIGTKIYSTYFFDIYNTDEYYDVTMICKVHTEATIVAQTGSSMTKKVSKLG
jgi:hypothetical protein